MEQIMAKLRELAEELWPWLMALAIVFIVFMVEWVWR